VSIESEYRRGYQDGVEGRERAEPSRGSAINTFLDGLFGSRSEDEVREAYDKGFTDGAQERSKHQTVQA